MGLPTLTVPHEQATKRIDELIAVGEEIITHIRDLPPLPVQATPRGLDRSDQLKAIEANRAVWIDKAKHTLVFISNGTALQDEFIQVTHRSYSTDQSWNVGSLTRSMESSVLKLKSIRDRLADFQVVPAGNVALTTPGLLDTTFSEESPLESLKRTRLGGLFLLVVACVSLTWTIQHYLYVSPKEERLKQKDERITELERRLSELSSGGSIVQPHDVGPGHDRAAVDDPLIVVPPTEVHETGSLQALSGQVLVTVTANMGKVALRVTTPEHIEGLHWEDLTAGDRREFTYGNDTLFVDVLSVRLVFRGLSALANRYTTTISVTNIALLNA